jgi:hypothetical protein
LFWIAKFAHRTAHKLADDLVAGGAYGVVAHCLEHPGQPADDQGRFDDHGRRPRTRSRLRPHV